MKKYLLIAHKFTYTKRGAHITSERLEKEFPNQIKYQVDIDSKNLEELNDEYKRLIFVTQAPIMYHFKMYHSRMKNLNYVLFIRHNFYPSLYNSCNNGFWYYKTYKTIKHYIPFITDFTPNVKLYKTRPCIGFYIRRFLTPDSHVHAVNWLKNLKYDVDVFTMGDNIKEILNFPNVKTYTHTNDNKKFFSNITHYVYPTSKIFQDPFPNSVLEAVHSNVQIIFLNIPYRNHVDGIDDIKECIKWHDDFNPIIEYDNSDCVLSFKNFKNFYSNILDNNFEYSFDRNKYKNFSNFIEREIL